jgi:RNA 2',3'-cyclic 3'-phosphodiesterase
MRTASSARLFVAVELPRLLREELAAWARTVLRPARPSRSGARIRLLDAQMLHLTVCFLGDRPLGELEQIVAALSQITWQAGALSLGAPLWLPPRRPHALAVEVHDEQQTLERVRAQAVDVLSGVCHGELLARRHFRPHVTVARIKDARGLGKEPLMITPAVSFVPDTLTLYRSWLEPLQARYQALISVNACPDKAAQTPPSEFGAGSERDLSRRDRSVHSAD